jgi:GTP-binding protein EngB required for normal cell division
MGGDRLELLGRAVEAGRRLGLEAEARAAASVLEQATARAGFAGDSYVLALAGGTGVGKSSVLNALAGRTVSAVRAVRPTTDEPVAWLAAHRQDELMPLLDWLGVSHLTGHADQDLAQIAILDLPDVDSVRTDHRARADELLPRIDALAWVVDPEKYDDERQHAYLRDLAPHASRLRVILNKADRLTDDEIRLVSNDLERRMDAEGLNDVPIHVVSAVTGRGVPELRGALAAQADAKTIVAARLAADADAAIRRVAAAAAVDGPEPQPLLTTEARATAVRQAQAAALALIDPDGLARQARGAVLARARRTGGGLLARTVNLLARLSGFEARRADPAVHLAGWRRRGTLAPVLNPVRAALVEAGALLPAGSRAGLLATIGVGEMDRSIEEAIDAATRETALEARPPGSVLWPLIGMLQLVAAAVLLFAVAWYATLFLVPGASAGVATIQVPVIGALPMPLALLSGGLLASVLLGALLTLHATWVGHRFAGRVAALVKRRVADAVEQEAFGPLDQAESARRELGDAVR